MSSWARSAPPVHHGSVRDRGARRHARPPLRWTGGARARPSTHGPWSSGSVSTRPTSSAGRAPRSRSCARSSAARRPEGPSRTPGAPSARCGSRRCDRMCRSTSQASARSCCGWQERSAAAPCRWRRRRSPSRTSSPTSTTALAPPGVTWTTSRSWPAPGSRSPPTEAWSRSRCAAWSRPSARISSRAPCHDRARAGRFRGPAEPRRSRPAGGRRRRGHHADVQACAGGSPDDVAARVNGLRDAGVTHVSLGGPLGPDPREAIRLLGERVLPTVR